MDHSFCMTLMKRWWLPGSGMSNSLLPVSFCWPRVAVVGPRSQTTVV